MPRHSASTAIRVLRLRLKDKHAPALQAMAADVNFVWNYSNELSAKVWERERRFMSGFDFHPFTRCDGRTIARRSCKEQALPVAKVSRLTDFERVHKPDKFRAR